VPANVAEKVLPTTPGPLHVPPAGVATRVTTVSVKHTLGGALVNVIFGNGSTVIVNVTGVPEQLIPPPVKLGVTVIVPLIAALVVLVAVKLAILPAPLAARPMPVLLFVQLNTVPGTVPVNVTAVVDAPLQTDWLATAATVAVGLTVIVKLTGTPAQAPGAVGVTVIVALIGAVVAFVAVKLAMLPVPLAANPIAVLLFVHAKVVPATPPTKLTAAVAAALQSTWLTGTRTVAVGLTVIVNVTGVPKQVTPPLR